MPDLPPKSLAAREQKLLENAHRAFERGELEYTLTACAEVLTAAPGCLTARRLYRAASRKKFSRTGGWIGKAIGGLTSLPFTLSGRDTSPAAQLAQSDKILAKDPYSITGLRLLAEAALAHDWPETAAFALEAIRELEPDNRDNLLALGEAWLAAQNPEAALRVADAVLALNAVDGAGQDLMRKASIARATREGRWEAGGNYRAKLAEGEKKAAVPQSTAPTADSARTSSAIDQPSIDPLGDAQAAVTRHPGDAEARLRLAEILLAAGQVEAAIAHFQQVQRNPRLRHRALLGLSRGFRARRLTDLAITQLQTAKQEMTVMDELKKEIIYELGRCFEEQQQADAAIDQFKEIYAEDIGFRDVATKINAHFS
ncbi:MAG: tetratricopeptide repeat protein [Opitutaceae bacterium]|nr:tetratricopeptide repeat protein [Opitutaceae bacterium]